MACTRHGFSLSVKLPVWLTKFIHSDSYSFYMHKHEEALYANQTGKLAC